MTRKISIWILAVLAGFATVARAQDAAPTPAAQESKTTALSATSDSHYIIGPQDVLDVD